MLGAAAPAYFSPVSSPESTLSSLVYQSARFCAAKRSNEPDRRLTSCRARLGCGLPRLMGRVGLVALAAGLITALLRAKNEGRRNNQREKQRSIAPVPPTGCVAHTGELKKSPPAEEAPDDAVSWAYISHSPDNAQLCT